jgi:molybdopterin molybdotransferase
MLELEEARSRILAVLPKFAGESVMLREACGRVCAQSLASPTDLPVFDNTAVDGYAVRAQDVAAASSQSPARLQCIGKISAGESFAGELGPTQCLRLFTGSPLPRGSDAVVMQEDTRIEEKQPDQILALDPVKAWENVRFRGEDVKHGSRLVNTGEILTVGRIALLAAVGLAEINVGRRPTVGLLATGSELKEAGEPLAPGQIYESNRLTLAPLIEQAGGAVKSYPIVPDVLESTRAALERAFNECDLVVTCGGVSVGEMDFVKPAFESLGGRLEFWKVAIRPGRPFVFGRREEKFLFGLPGNPVSALVTFLLLVRPALRRWQGAEDVLLSSFPGTLAEPLANPGARRHFTRVFVDQAGQVRSAGIQASHILSSTAAANGLVEIPPETNFAAGTIVPVLRWE